MRARDAASPVRLRDVAEAAGVNPSIASRILNDDPTLSARPETRSRVRDAARRLGYTPNAFARGLKLQRTNTLGLVLPGVANAVNAELVQGVERRAAHHGYVVLLADMDDFARSGDVYRRLVLERRVDGLIVSGPSAGHRLIGDLSSQRIPNVVLNRRSARGAVCVSAHFAAGIALAVDHLVELGHRHIAHAAGLPGGNAAGGGLGGYRAALDRHGLACGDSVVEADLTEEGGFDASAALLEAAPQTTALVVSTVTQGVGAMAAIRRAGLTVPGDISIVAFHDAPLAAYLDPPLTAVRLPLREVAEAAVDQMVKLISGEEAGDVLVATAPELIVRSSTSLPSRGT